MGVVSFSTGARRGCVGYLFAGRPVRAHRIAMPCLRLQAPILSLLSPHAGAGARGQLQGMGDAERREAAASLMLRLMGALGLDEEDGGEGSSSEEEEGGGGGEAAAPGAAAAAAQ